MKQDTNIIKKFMAAEGREKNRLFPSFKETINEMILAGRREDALNALRPAVSIDSDYSRLKSLYGLIQKARDTNDGMPKGTPIRLAILGGYTTQQLTWLIDLFLFSAAIDAQIYEAEYGVMSQEVYNKNSELYQFNPQIVFLACGRRDVPKFPAIGEDQNKIDAMLNEEVARWKGLWDALKGRLDCQIIQNNFEMPSESVLGHLEFKMPYAQGAYLRKLNDMLREQTPLTVCFHDMDTLSSNFGRWNWIDDRFYFDSKLPCTPELLPIYAYSIVSIVKAIMGKSKKCLVLDLDNTLWGGVIGDDGLGGITLGQGDPIGEAFQAFQHYAKRLKERGIILSVCSKNDEENAKEPFEKHPDMILKLDDISCFVANWDNKVTNLKRIAQDLNIGVDSLVFVDDNPAERGLVRYHLPEVVVPELENDPANFIRTIEKYRYFETVHLNQEDLKRAEMYSQEIKRKKFQENVTDINDYLKTLNMREKLEPINDLNIDRVVQLVNKTNQFNLTTKRYAKIQIDSLRKDQDWITRTARLSDAFGDYGLISVVLGNVDKEILNIDTWLMSCRVLNRGVEESLMEDIFEMAKRSRLKRITGEYRPTPKNKMVKDFYSRLGFEKVSESADGTIRWQIDVDSANSYRWKHHIKKEV